ncbi:unnamed protein product [Brassica rapa subsp. narinosa]
MHSIAQISASNSACKVVHESFPRWLLISPSSAHLL